MPTTKKFDNFSVDLDNILGKGPYGHVYLGKDLQTSQAVAAKQVYVHYKFKEDYIKQEVESLVKMESHKNILQFVGSLKDGDCYWNLTEYCELRDVDNFCSKNALTGRLKVDIMLQVARAIYFLHHLEPPVVHRDISLENVILTDEQVRIIEKL